MVDKIYKIHKGCHYSNFIPSFKCLKDETVFSKFLSFRNNCAYQIDEKSCVNKLFGMCFGIFGVHMTSFRFGWTYEKDTDRICIWQYYYINGKLHKNIVKKVTFNHYHLYSIKVLKNKDIDNFYLVAFYIDNELIETHPVNSKLPYSISLGPYFGGNTKAPHDIEIHEIKY